MADIIINPKQGQRIGDYIFRGNSFRKESNAKKIKRNQHVDTNGYRIYNNVAIPFGYKTKSAITWMRSKINKYSLPTKPQLSQEDRRLTNPLLSLNQGGNLIEQKPTPLVPQIPLDLVKNTDPLTLGFTNLTPEVSPIRNLAPLPAPFFGYRTNNTYEDSDFRNKLETLGIRSNADLINFGWRTQGKDYDWKGNDWAKLFRSDLDRILGKNWSDENIRRAFNTSGKWGKGFLGSGDFSDFQKSLLESAGVWNSDYDRRKVGYENSLANQLKGPKWLPQILNSINSLWTTHTPSWRNNLLGALNLSFYKKGGTLSPRDPVKRFKSFLKGGSLLKTEKFQLGGYIVKKGDNLSKIAKNLGISLLTIMDLNPQIKDFNKVYVGDLINLPQLKKLEVVLLKPLPEKPKKFFLRISEKVLKNPPKSKPKTLKQKYWNLSPKERKSWVGENMNTYENTPEYRAEFDRYKPHSTETGAVLYRSRLGDLGLVSNGDGTYCMYDSEGKKVTKCALTINRLLESLGLRRNTVGDAWTSLGLYGDSVLVNGFKYQPKIGSYNPITFGAHTALANAAVLASLPNLDLLTGDMVGLSSINSAYNEKAWNEGTNNRSNSHLGMIFRPDPKRKDLTYIIHNVSGTIYVDPISKFMWNSEDGDINYWAPTYISRPKQGPTPLSKPELSSKLVYNASPDGKNFYDYLTTEGMKHYGLDIHSGKQYILVNGNPKQI